MSKPQKIGTVTIDLIARMGELIGFARGLYGDSVVADYAQQGKLIELAIKTAIARGERLNERSIA